METHSFLSNLFLFATDFKNHLFFTEILMVFFFLFWFEFFFVVSARSEESANGLLLERRSFLGANHLKKRIWVRIVVSFFFFSPFSPFSLSLSLTALIASSNTCFKPFCVNALHSM